MYSVVTLLSAVIYKDSQCQKVLNFTHIHFTQQCNWFRLFGTEKNTVHTFVTLEI